MIKVNVKKLSNYPVSSVRVKKVLNNFLVKRGIVSESVVDISIVSAKRMLAIAKDYKKENPPKMHNVLSFTATESTSEFVYPPDGPLYLGEIILCYPQIVEEAKKEGVLIDNKIDELLKHSALHLLGIHHKE